MPILRCATVVYRFDRKRRPLADDGKNEKVEESLRFELSNGILPLYVPL